jgi:hypothetical protein
VGFKIAIISQIFLTDYSKQQLVQETALSDADIEQVRQCRRDPNRLGFAY